MSKKVLWGKIHAIQRQFNGCLNYFHEINGQHPFCLPVELRAKMEKNLENIDRDLREFLIGLENE